ncbi:MAG TPA: DUF3800 domain-containing protein [Caulobacteraceae bacterium]|nr:DUF3800 domain-containing protein [Caulobacteraceae bacterium]
MQHYVAYIDEAGDDGFSMLGKGVRTGQSQWLVLGALLVTKENDLHLPKWRDAIRERFPNKTAPDLHFRNLRHEQKVVATQDLAALPVGLCMAFSNKATLPGSKWEKTFAQKGYLYNYLIRWVLERLTSVCAFHSDADGARLKVIFSHRKGMNYQAMRDYLILMRDGRELVRPVRSIRWDVLDVNAIAVENHSRWAGLQLADCATSAFFAAVEPDQFGNYEPRYALALKDLLLKERGLAMNCGLAPVPSFRDSRPNEQQRAFFLECCKRKEQAPGP